MKKIILIINGEKYWQEFFPEYDVQQKFIQDTSWILKNGELFVADKNGVVKPDGILWRVGAIKPTAIQTNALNLIALANIPCVNSAQTLQKGFDRLSMLSQMKQLGLPVIDFDVVTNANMIKNIETTFPFVVKVGNYHGGYGKVLIENAEKWQDIQDLLFVTDDYVSVEPYIDYKYDIRYLAIADKTWAMSRKGRFWKANVHTTDFKQITVQADIAKQLTTLQQHLGADIIAIDILEDHAGKQYIVEYNDIPGLSGFTDELKYELANCLMREMSK